MPGESAVTHAAPLAAGELEELRGRLLAERQRILALYEHDRQEALEVHEEPAEDRVDRAEADFERDLLLTFSESEREQLRLIEDALQRIREGTYGRCLRTGRPIPLARLREVPWAQYGVEVQARLEAERA